MKYNVHWSIILTEDFVIEAENEEQAREIFESKIMDEISFNDMDFCDDNIDTWECEDQDEEEHYMLRKENENGI